MKTLQKHVKIRVKSQLEAPLPGRQCLLSAGKTAPWAAIIRNEAALGKARTATETRKYPR